MGYWIYCMPYGFLTRLQSILIGSLVQQSDHSNFFARVRAERQCWQWKCQQQATLHTLFLNVAKNCLFFKDTLQVEGIDSCIVFAV